MSTNRKPIVIDAGQLQQTPDQDDLLLMGGALIKNGVDSGNTKVIPAGYSLIVVGPYDVQGTLDIQGTLVIL